MLPLPEPIRAFLEKSAADLIEFVRAHVFKSLGSTVAFTLLSVFLLINPWFGSETAKFHLVDFMIEDADGVSALLTRFAKNPVSKQKFVDGAAQAGFYLSGDKHIVENWAEQFPINSSKIVDVRHLDPSRYGALLYARQRSLNRDSPFQAIGLSMVASSPSCPQTRPDMGQVYISTRANFGSQFASAQNVSIVRDDGVGIPVTAKVSLLADMSPNTDMYLNRRQMVDYLKYTGKEPLTVRVTITNDEPNQDMPDRYPSEVQIDCTKG